MSDTEISAFLDRCTGRQMKELLALASPGATATRNSLLEVGSWEQMENLLAASDPSPRVILEAVCSAQTSIETLIAIKGDAKRLAANAETPPHKAAATLLYHLAVASALAYHGRNISSKAPSGRLALYKDLATELSDDALASIFEKALANISPASD